MTKGYKTGGRKPLTPAGPAVLKAFRLPAEVMADLEEMSDETGRSVADIVRAGAEAEVKKWRKRTGRPPR